jgi:hypothetical protein
MPYGFSNYGERALEQRRRSPDADVRLLLEEVPRLVCCSSTWSGVAMPSTLSVITLFVKCGDVIPI